MEPTEHAQATGRASGRHLTVTLGLLNVPITAHNALADHKSVPSRSTFSKLTGNPVGAQPYDKVTNEPLERDATEKKLVIDDQVYELTDDEIAEACTDPELPKGTIRIHSRIPLEAIGTKYVVEGLGYALPAEKKVGTKRVADPVAVKAFRMLTDTLGELGQAALMEMPQAKGAPRWMALTPDGRLLYLAFAEAVRPTPALPAPTYSEAEFAMARRLVGTIPVEEPVLADAGGRRLMHYIGQKASGGEVVRPEAAPVAPVIDLMAVMAASLEAAGGEAEAPAKPKRTRKVS